MARPSCDFVVIDEVQDLTPVQLALLLATLQKPGQFVLCGDSNQIVHPNFFPWTAVRALFWHGLAGEAAQRQDLSVLQANFRNTRSVTRLANTLLQIKQSRFGSIDRESNFLVRSAALEEGEVRLLPARDKGDKSLELYKFYVNALYVAMTRAVESLVLVESDTQHPLLQLLGLEVASAASTQPAAPVSTREEWAQEARKLELQGKEE